MELERPIPRAASTAGDPLAGGPMADEGRPDDVRAKTREILDAVDRALDSIPPLNAEDYLQQNRQRGGE